MRLTDIQKLSKGYTSNDWTEMAAVMQSTHLSSPSGKIRWGKVKESEALTWMISMVASSMKEEFQIERMSTAIDLTTKDIPPRACAEHLIIRDLDMNHLQNDTSNTNKTPGRIIAHADWRYDPGFSGRLEDATSKVNPTSDKPTHPAGFNKTLDDKLNTGITTSVATHFTGLPFFYLLGISTLTPSHLRKGIAKILVQWIEPYIDHYSVPVVLYASPLGLHLYRACGYEEYRDLDVAIDLEGWGVDEIHRHVVMIRWPKDQDRLPDAWKEWRRKYNGVQVSP